MHFRLAEPVLPLRFPTAFPRVLRFSMQMEGARGDAAIYYEVEGRH